MGIAVPVRTCLTTEVVMNPRGRCWGTFMFCTVKFRHSGNALRCLEAKLSGRFHEFQQAAIQRQSVYQRQRNKQIPSKRAGKVAKGSDSKRSVQPGSSGTLSRQMVACGLQTLTDVGALHTSIKGVELPEIKLKWNSISSCIEARWSPTAAKCRKAGLIPPEQPHRLRPPRLSLHYCRHGRHSKPTSRRAIQDFFLLGAGSLHCPAKELFKEDPRPSLRASDPHYQAHPPACFRRSPVHHGERKPLGIAGECCNGCGVMGIAWQRIS